MKAFPSLPCLLGILLTASGLHAATYHVSVKGLDSNPGTLAAPWRSIQKAADSVAPGDAVLIRGGSYRERVKLATSGTAAARITFRAYAREKAALDGTGLILPEGEAPLFDLSDTSHITLQDLTFRNLQTQSDQTVPIGIWIRGASDSVHILGCTVHTIRQNNPVKFNDNANAHGIAAYGTRNSPIQGLRIENCVLHSLRLGASEALVLNGNVSGFTIAGNTVHDCNNIGIDIIGHEGVNPDPALDRARDGVITQNTIYGITSVRNPAYGGSFTRGGGERSAAGIYIDGGTRVLIERNIVRGCNIGLELASEHAGKSTDFITVRNNLLRHNHITGIALGGYDEQRGATTDCAIHHNTLYANDTTRSWSGQIMIQHFVSRCAFTHNIIQAPSWSGQMVIAEPALGAGNQFNHNLYFCSTRAAASIEFVTGGESHEGMSAWQSLGFDSMSRYLAPGFSNAASGNFRLSAISVARDTGNPDFTPESGEFDLAGLPRLSGSRTDPGAYEFQQP